MKNMKYSCKYVWFTTKMENDFLINANSVLIEFNSGAKIVCQNFHTNRQGKYEVFIYDSVKNIWIKANLKNECTKIMHECFMKHNKKCKLNIRSYMSHSRVKKCGSGGTRLSKWNGTVTDYECSKVPLHDFPRSYCVNWN